MKFWCYLLLGLALVISLFWLLAVALGLLQYLIWAIVLGGAITAVVGFLLRPRGIQLQSRHVPGLREHGKAERELKKMEKRQSRERAR